EVFLRPAAPPQRFLDERTDSYWRASRSVSSRAFGENADVVPDAELGWRMKPQSGARLLVVVIGHSYDGQPEHLWIEQSIVQACRTGGIECLNLAAARREVDSTPLYGQNGHFSAQGHRFVAEKIAEALALAH